MSMFSRIGHTPRLVAAAAVSFSLLAGVAAAQNGYVEVRVRDDNSGCGPVVLKWPADQEEREYDPNPAANDPKLEMAETRPLPVIHHHPGLNAGALYLPPQDGIYRHYFPESEAPPRLRRWDRPEYEEYLREHNPSTDVPFAVLGATPPDARQLAAAPSTVYVPTGLTTPPAAFTGAPGGGYVAVPNAPATFGVGPLPEEAAPGVIGTSQTTYVPASEMTTLASSTTTTPPAVQTTIAPSFTEQTVVTPRPSAVKPSEEGTGSFIHLSEPAEKIPFLGTPAGNAMLQSLVEEPPAAPAPSPITVPAALPTMTPAFGEPGNASTPATGCGAPVCQ